MATEHVARELVEQDHAGERALRIAEEMVRDILPFLLPERQEAVADLVIEGRIDLPPALRVLREPEIEEVVDLIRGQRLSPIRVSRSAPGPAGRRCCESCRQSLRAAPPAPAGHDI